MKFYDHKVDIEVVFNTGGSYINMHTLRKDQKFQTIKNYSISISNRNSEEK